jgi:uroporphyrinogen III methyltransferase / synthase
VTPQARELETVDAGACLRTNTGHAWLVGAGPGDPGLVTLAAVRSLETADVVLYDALVNTDILRHCRAGADIRFVGKRSGDHAASQAEIEQAIIAEALAGKRVVRLKGGDPFVFGRGGEEALACVAAGVPVTVIPGVTSAIAAPAYAGIPLTHRGVASSFMVITGSERGEELSAANWEAAARADTLVILMGAATLAQCMDRLMREGRDSGTPAACIRWGTTPAQQTVTATIGSIAEATAAAGLEAPLVTVVGDVVSLSARLKPPASGQLAGKRVAVTRSRDDAGTLSTQLAALGAEVVEAPVLTFSPIPGSLPLDNPVSGRWDWMVFTSPQAARAIAAELAGRGLDVRALGQARVAAIGEATRASVESALHLKADFVPSLATSVTLAAELPRVSGARILLPVSNLTDATLAGGLRKRGGFVEQVAVYETRPAQLDRGQRLRVAAADAVTFTSGSTARYLKVAMELPADVKLVSIGQRTSEALREAFGRVDAEARSPSLESLAEAVTEVLRGNAH